MREACSVFDICVIEEATEECDEWYDVRYGRQDVNSLARCVDTADP
jgi:hypothetical protein